jgi:hypothetical protein
LTTFVLSPAAAASPPTPLDPADAERSVAAFVDGKSAEIRAKLGDEFRQSDRRRLLQMKETVDTFVSTFLLLEDVAHRPAATWWSLPAEEFREGATSAWRTEGPEAPVASPAAASAQRRFSGRLTWFAPGGESHPVMLWTSGVVASGSGEVRVGHYEPYLANRSLAFPLHPERLIVRWDPTRLQVLDRDGARPLAEELAGERDPIFNNPAYSYALFDTLRLKLGAAPGGPSATAHAFPPADASWRVAFENGRPIREVRQAVTEDGIQVEIRQRSVLLHHQSPVTFELRRDYADGRSVAEPFVPATEVEYLEGGRDVTIGLKAEADDWMPRTVAVSASGALLFEATLDPIAPGSHADLEDVGDVLHGLDEVYLALDRGLMAGAIREHPIERIATGGPHARRVMLKHNVYLSLLNRDMDAAGMWLDEYRAMLESEGVPMRFHVYNVEAIAQTASDALDPAFGARIVTSLLRREYERTPPAELAEHAARLISQFRIGPAFVALDALARAGDAARAAWAAELLGTLKAAWRAGDIEPGTQYPFADRSARLTAAVLAVLDQASFHTPFAKESAR